MLGHMINEKKFNFFAKKFINSKNSFLEQFSFKLLVLLSNPLYLKMVSNLACSTRLSFNTYLVTNDQHPLWLQFLI